MRSSECSVIGTAQSAILNGMGNTSLEKRPSQHQRLICVAKDAVVLVQTLEKRHLQVKRKCMNEASNMSEPPCSSTHGSPIQRAQQAHVNQAFRLQGFKTQMTSAMLSAHPTDAIMHKAWYLPQIKPTNSKNFNWKAYRPLPTNVALRVKVSRYTH